MHKNLVKISPLVLEISIQRDNRTVWSNQISTVLDKPYTAMPQKHTRTHTQQDAQWKTEIDRCGSDMTHAFGDERAEMWQHLIQAGIRRQTVQSLLHVSITTADMRVTAPVGSDDTRGPRSKKRIFRSKFSVNFRTFFTVYNG